MYLQVSCKITKLKRVIFFQVNIIFMVSVLSMSHNSIINTAQYIKLFTCYVCGMANEFFLFLCTPQHKIYSNDRLEINVYFNINLLPVTFWMYCICLNTKALIALSRVLKRHRLGKSNTWLKVTYR